MPDFQVEIARLLDACYAVALHGEATLKSVATDDELSRLLRRERKRLRTQEPEQWDAAGALLTAAGAG